MDQRSELENIPDKELFLTFSKDEQEAILSMKAVKKFPKGSLLLEEGDRITHSFFVIKGCIRQFKLIDGVDKTNLFYTENNSVHLPPLTEEVAYSKFNLECLEDCTLSVVSLKTEKEFCKRFPRFEKMCRMTSEKNLVDFQEFFANYIASSPEERYLYLQETRSDLLNRVPQYHLATYLGVTAESLSRIRKRVANR